MAKKKSKKNNVPRGEQGPRLVKMVRERDGKTADVHPDEVENFKLGDYVVQQ